MLSNETDAAPDANRRDYRPEIDGMRCMAVALVVAYHLAPSVVPSGFVGVDAFFVVSGYVVTRSLLSRQPAGFGADLLAFYARRVQRLLPALVACVAATAVAFALVAPPIADTAACFRTGAMSLVGVSNWHLIAEGTDYFGAVAALDPFAHTWSLAIEEQFYLCFAPLLLLCRGAGAGVRVLAAAVLTLAIVASFAWFMNAGGTVPGYFATTGRAWEMLLGVAVAALPQAEADRCRRTTRAALGLIATLVVALSELPAAWASALSALAAASMLLGSGPRTDALLASRPLRWVGIRSYGIYLWHWPLIVLLDRAVGRSGWTAALAVAGTVVVAAASFRLAEAPIRSMRIAGTRQAARRVLAGACTIAATALLVAVTAWGINPRWSATGSTARDLDRDPSGPGPLGGPATARMELVVLGDSHAQMLWPALRTCTETLGLLVRNATGTGMLVSEELALDRADRDYGARREFVRRTVDEASMQGPIPRALLIACRFTGYLESRQLDPTHVPPATLLAGAERVTTGSDEAFRRFERSLESTVSRAEAAAVPVIIMAPIPELAHSPLEGLLVRGRGIEQPTRAEEEALRSRTIDAMRRVAARFANVTIWDPIDVLCPGPTMNPWRDGRLLYRDTNHLSAFGARTVAPGLCDAIQRATGLSN